MSEQVDHFRILLPGCEQAESAVVTSPIRGSGLQERRAHAQPSPANYRESSHLLARCAPAFGNSPDFDCSISVGQGLFHPYEYACGWDSYEATTLTRKTMSGAPTLLGIRTSDSIQPLPCTRKLARTVPSQDDEAERRGSVCGFELTGRLHC
jgi:hypothetical protein